MCEHLELYRACQSQIGKEQFFNLLPDQRDSQLKSALESEKKLHPALFSAASEHKVGSSLYVLPFVCCCFLGLTICFCTGRWVKSGNWEMRPTLSVLFFFSKKCSP
jgi:hypothetical protein